MDNDTDTTPQDVTITEYTMPDGATGIIQRAPNGHFLPGTRPHNVITSDNARTMQARWQDIRRQSKLRGLARGAGIDPDTIDKDLVAAAGDASEALTSHFVTTFLSSNALSSMSDAYRALLSSRDDDDKSDTGAAATITLSSRAVDVLAAAMSRTRHDDTNDS